MPANTDALVMWVIYDHPRDRPNVFVARKWLVRAEGAEPTEEIFEARTLKGVRAKLPPGLTRLPRDLNDQLQIVESWF